MTTQFPCPICGGEYLSQPCSRCDDVGWIEVTEQEVPYGGETARVYSMGSYTPELIAMSSAVEQAAGSFVEMTEAAENLEYVLTRNRKGESRFAESMDAVRALQTAPTGAVFRDKYGDVWVKEEWNDLRGRPQQGMTFLYPGGNILRGKPYREVWAMKGPLERITTTSWG